MMDAGRSVEILSKLRERAIKLKEVTSDNPEFTKWRRDTEIAIQRIFGETNRHHADFTKIGYSLRIISTGTPRSEFHRAYLDGLARAEAILSSMIDEIKDYELDSEETKSPVKGLDSLTLIERICLRFHLVARQLRSRHGNRGTLEIEDEYDVQDLLHALLKLHFDDVRAEEWTPSYAGGAARVDFLLKQERVIIEVKKTRPSLSSKDIGDQLIVDIARYDKHPDCGQLICFIYDPEGRIGNPIGLERDLEGHAGQLKVRVIIGPRSH